jgi:glycerol-3-phosphate cytidylyltransferase
MKKVITYGTFDLLHYGHINLLKRAKALGDYLIVGVTSDNYDKYRGKLNVSQSVIERIENVKATSLADEIIVEEYEGQKIDDIVGCKVDIFAIGSDWIGKFDYLQEYCQVIYLERTKGISSTELRNNKHALIRFGIVGSGRIANRFIPESKYVSGLSVEGVFGINEDSAKAFFEKHQLAFYTTNYSEFLEKIDAVYIASPHDSHYQYAKQALLSGKNVLCEKPLVLSKDEASELFALAQLKRLVLMEALKTAYCPGFLRLISLAKSGKIGEIKSVDAAFTKLVPPHVREMQSEHAGGSVTELATYPLFAIIKLLGSNFVDIHFTSCYKQGVDIFTKIDIVYSHAVASAKVGLGVKTEGDLIISGTRGYVYVPAPWWKTDYFELRFENLADTEKYYYKFSGDGLRYEIVEFLNRIGKEIYTNQDETTQIVNIIEMFRNRMKEITQI